MTQEEGSGGIIKRLGLLCNTGAQVDLSQRSRLQFVQNVSPTEEA